MKLSLHLITIREALCLILSVSITQTVVHRAWQSLKFTFQGKGTGGDNGHGATRVTKTRQDYTEVFMHVITGNLKLEKIKGFNKSKEKGYPNREGNGKSFLFVSVEGL